jgi:D-alanyl-lipoteichoic acid acyltransferase DltB (MBOAT superfamily)
MLFTTGKYWLFLTIVFFVYWSVARRRSLRVIVILLASYYFYALWNPTFVPLLFALSTIDFLTARGISLTTNSRLRRGLLLISIVTDVGTLIVFKYFNFFSTSATALLELLHWQTRSFLIEDLVIPLGLSFLTFRSLSYVIDVYRKTMPATNRYLDYLAFVAFFPTLIAGPVVRAKELLPQFSQTKIENEQGVEAIFLILIGLVKKVAIADVIGMNLVDRVFDQPQLYSSLETLAAIYGYALQIYCDFSGYSDIAIGSAMLLGFKLPDNFNSPYRALNLRDFWRRWHITLSNWLFDYVYLSIGGLRKRRFNLYRNLFLTFLIGGLWHGASWTFVIWGALHGIGLSLNHWWSARHKSQSIRPRWRKLLSTIATFHFVCLTWIVFRSQTLSQSFEVLKRLGALQFSAANLPTSLLLLLVLGFASHFAPARVTTSLRDAWGWLPAPAQAVVVLSIAFGLYYVSGTEVQFIYGNF